MSRTDAASRVIAATPSAVYAALVDRGALTAWLPPAGMTARFEHFDPQPGGSYRLVLTYADAAGAPGKSSADSDIVEARYVELVPGSRVVHTVDFASDDPAYAGTMTMTWELRDDPGGTRVDITAANVPEGISAEDHAAGLSSALANLADYVVKPPSELKRVVHDMIEALNAGEFDRAYQPVSDDCTHVSPVGALHGRDALKASEVPLLEQLEPQWRRIERLVVSGNNVAFWITFGGTVKATGKSFETEVCNVLTFAEASIVEWRSYADYSNALEAWSPND